MFLHFGGYQGAGLLPVLADVLHRRIVPTPRLQGGAREDKGTAMLRALMVSCHLECTRMVSAVFKKVPGKLG